MLADTAVQNIADLEGISVNEYSIKKISSWRTHLAQLLHIATRPVSIRLSAYFADRFNAFLRVDAEELRSAIEMIRPGDSILWLNPSRAVKKIVEDLRPRCKYMHLYFVDPVHRLGVSPFTVREWATWAWVGTYSKHEAIELGIRFLIPYAPAVHRSGGNKDYDVVYVGSPSPKRLLWLLFIRLKLYLDGRRGFLRLASNNTHLRALFPGIFSDRICFREYIALCERSHSILEIHERDSGGVTLRATLAQSLQVVHLCNQKITPQTVVISLFNCISSILTVRESDIFGKDAGPPRLEVLHFDNWLRANFIDPYVAAVIR